MSFHLMKKIRKEIKECRKRESKMASTCIKLILMIFYTISKVLYSNSKFAFILTKLQVLNFSFWTYILWERLGRISLNFL